MCEVAINAGKVLRGESKKAVYRGLKTVSEVGELARQRWLVPRAATRTEYKDWKRDQFKHLVLLKRNRGEMPALDSSEARERDANGSR
jgi:hypothetical protein